MANVNLIMDIGSSNVTIYKEGEGIVLREPTMVLVEGNEDKYRIVDYGINAYNRISQLPGGYRLIYPVVQGSIKYKKVARALIEHFIKKVVVRTDYFLKPRIRVFINIPCGSGKEERELFEDLLYSSMVDESYQLEAPIFATYGSDMVVTESPTMVVDIGGGITDVALVSSNGIEKGASYGLGGIDVDLGIIESLESSLSLSVGQITAENLKIEIGSLYENENASITVYGKNTLTGNPKSSLVTTKHLRSMLEYYYGRIGDVVLNFLKELPDQTIASVYEKGILFTGGGSQLRGLEQFLKKYTKAPIIIMERSGYASIYGGAKLLSQPKQFNRLLKIL